tara:strand:- start:621 stop:902 length:282 start_codon:yes stop_codon:yes gene_type:complete
MQKIINVLAVASAAVSVTVVGSGLYVYVNRSSIIDGVKSQVMEAVTGSLGGGAGLGGSLPIGAPDLASPADQASAPDAPTAPVPSPGLGVPTF